MANPFEPFPHRPKESTPNARLPVQRLLAVGAPAHVVAEAERRWAGASAEERARAREAFDATTSEELADQVVDMEFGHALDSAGLTDEDERPDDAIDLLPAALEANAGSVDEARAWVENSTQGHPADRALAMLVAEARRPADHQRKTLVDPLRARVRGD